MRTLALVGAVAMLLVGTAMGQSQVAFTLQVGGDNNADDWENGVYAAFDNSAAKGRTDLPLYALDANVSSVLTWNVNAAVTDPAGNAGVQGLANIVFDLTLLDSSSQPVAAARYFSTINDGDYVNPSFGAKDAYEMAAFALGWDVDLDAAYAGDGIPDGAGPPNAPGRLFDSAANAGAYMDRAQFPSTNRHGGGRRSGESYFDDCNANGIIDWDPNTGLPNDGPDTDGDGIIDACETPAANVTNAPDGTLLGMGLGYSQLSMGTGVSAIGVGIAFGGLQPAWAAVGGFYVGMGTGPAAEGQIDMSNVLAAGTYTLVLSAPAAGQNVVKATYDPITAPGGSFAEAAGSVLEVQAGVADYVSFVWTPAALPVDVASWKSVKTHSTTAPQELAITLNWATGQNATSESRSGRTGDPVGIEKIVMNTTGGTPALVSPLPATWGGLTVTGASISGNDVIVTLSGCVNATCYTLDASAIIANLANPAADSATCKVVAMIGDANNSRSVNTTDFTSVKNNIGAPLTDANCRVDINCSKSINTTDYTQVKNRNPTSSVSCVN